MQTFKPSPHDRTRLAEEYRKRLEERDILLVILNDCLYFIRDEVSGKIFRNKLVDRIEKFLNFCKG